MTTSLRHSTALLLLAFSIQGCLPASRTTHSANRSKQDAQVLHTAHSAEGLSATRRQVLMAAEQWLGTPYRYGGSSTSGTDCSGFVRSVFRDVRVALPRTSSEQATVGSSISRGNLQAGDLLFFNTSGGGVSHVGIAIDREKFIHASTSSGVIVSSLNDDYYAGTFMFARRVL